MSGFGNTPVTTGTPVGTPLGSVAVPGHSGGDLSALRGANASTDINGNETASVAAWIENVTALGQALKNASSPVVIASDQWSFTSPAIVEQNFQSAVRAGNAFYACTDALTGSVTHAAFSLFNPVASGKNFLVWALNILSASAANFSQLRITSTNPSLATTASAANFTLGNLNAGSGTTSVASATYAAASVTVPALSASSLALGTYQNVTGGAGAVGNNAILAPVVLVPGTGLVAYLNVASGTLSFAAYWAESAAI